MAGLTQEYLQHLLHYDPLTGKWTWVNPRSSKLRPGDPAGSLQTKGYWYIKIDGRSYIAARLAFLYMTGQYPEEVDHDNRISWDDRWENLKPSDRTGNTTNRVMIGESGHPGVYKHSQNDRWVASYKKVYIGSYTTIEEAAAKRQEFMELHGLAPTVSDIERNAS